MRPLAAAAVALAIVAIVLIYLREPDGEDKAPPPEAPVETIESEPEVESTAPAPEPLPLPEPAAPPLPHPRPRGPIEPLLAYAALVTSIVDPRLDAVDECRERFTLPPLSQLLARSTIIPGLGVGPHAQEAALQQTFVFEISTSNGAYVIDGVEPVESSLEFPAPDGTMRRVTFDDDRLDRCIAGVLRGATAPSGEPDGKRFWVEGHAGEAVYDLPTH